MVSPNLTEGIVVSAHSCAIIELNYLEPGFFRAMRGAEGTTWDGIPSESPPQAGFFLSFTITKMGWESLSLMMVIRWDGKHEEMH